MLLRLRLAHRLLLIYLLSFVSLAVLAYSLIAEKNIAIEFAQKERRGTAYVAVVRDAGQLAAILRRLSAKGRGDFAARRSHASDDGCEAIHFPHRHESNLILDPDFDIYYAMSIVTLRLPELVARLPLGRSA